MIKLLLIILNILPYQTIEPGYEYLDGNTENIRKIIEDNHEVSSLIKSANKPI